MPARVRELITTEDADWSLLDMTGQILELVDAQNVDDVMAALPVWLFEAFADCVHILRNLQIDPRPPQLAFDAFDSWQSRQR